MNWPGIYASSSSFGALVMTTNGLATMNVPHLF